jgi:hypothetical protein
MTPSFLMTLGLPFKLWEEDSIKKPFGPFRATQWGDIQEEQFI